jgi:hypothetical protein
MDCDNCFAENATINEVCLPVLIRSENIKIDDNESWKKIVNLPIKDPQYGVFAR